jgi:PAS domain-containing protein
VLAPVVEAGYVNVYGLDTTERKQAERALRESEIDLSRAQAAARVNYTSPRFYPVIE